MAATDTLEGVRGSAPTNPPRENLVRATPGIELRDNPSGMPTLTGHFAVWDQWTEIRSAYEGNFMERFSPGSMTKTLTESTPKVLFGHGKDNVIGDKPLGTVVRLEPDGDGAYYEVQLFDTSYNRDLLPGLEAGVYGASHRFSVVSENVVQRPPKSDYNPRGIPERTVQEARVMEFGPCTFPAYAGASAGIRSMTDEYLFDALVEDPERLRELCRRSGISLAGVETSFSDIVTTSSGGVTINVTTTAPETRTEVAEERMAWTTAYIDALPDSAFLHIDENGRHFPYKDAQGNVDLPHLRNALARIPDSSLSADSVKAMLTAKAQKILAAQDGRSMEPDASERTTPETEAPGIEPEPSEATTHSLTRDHFRFTAPPKHLRS